MYVCMYACMYIVGQYTSIYTYHISMHMYVYYLYVHMHLCLVTYTHIHTHTHTHVCMFIQHNTRRSVLRACKSQSIHEKPNMAYTFIARMIQICHTRTISCTCICTCIFTSKCTFICMQYLYTRYHLHVHVCAYDINM